MLETLTFNHPIEEIRLLSVHLIKQNYVSFKTLHVSRHKDCEKLFLGRIYDSLTESWLEVAREKHFGRKEWPYFHEL